jgi:hypothetical protein
MKILFVTNYNSIARHSGGFINDFLNDLLFYGLYENLGTDVVDSTQIISLYKEFEPKIPKQHLWGKFTAFYLIDPNSTDRTDIESKIRNKYFDFIVYGAIRRCMDYWDLVTKTYPKNKIILLDGNDDQDVLSFCDEYPYFKRELVDSEDLPKKVYPISFSIPTCKVTKNKNIKKQRYIATCNPFDKSTYIFTDETKYYNDYTDSFFGITSKKAGWDCLRHYEILANYCMPLFVDVQHCPNNTMVDYPKALCGSSFKWIDQSKLNSSEYFDTLDSVFKVLETKLTTKAVADKFLKTISSF